MNSSTNALPFMTKARTMRLQKRFPAPGAEKQTWGERGGSWAETEPRKGLIYNHGRNQSPGL